MYPLPQPILRLPDLARHWRRHFPERPPAEELVETLLQAFWQGMSVLCRADGTPVRRVGVLGMVRAAAPHPGMLIYEQPGHPPPLKQELPDGGVTIVLGHRVYLPSQTADWSDEIISAACSTLAVCRWTDYSASAHMGLLELAMTRDAFEALCVERGYERPPFWFGRDATGKAARSFGGRPSVMRPIEAEMRRHALQGDLKPTLREEARSLHAWASHNIPAAAQIPTMHAIENALREVYRELRHLGPPAHKT